MTPDFEQLFGLTPPSIRYSFQAANSDRLWCIYDFSLDYSLPTKEKLANLAHAVIHFGDNVRAGDTISCGYAPYQTISYARIAFFAKGNDEVFSVTRRIPVLSVEAIRSDIEALSNDFSDALKEYGVKAICYGYRLND